MLYFLGRRLILMVRLGDPGKVNFHANLRVKGRSYFAREGCVYHI